MQPGNVDIMIFSPDKIFNPEFLDATRNFLRSCLRMSPYRKCVKQFENYEAGNDLDSLIYNSLVEFSHDLKRWNWEFKNADDLYDRLLLSTNMQVPFFYRISRTFFINRLEMFAHVIAVLARWMTGVEIYYTAEIGSSLKVSHGMGTVIGAHSQIGSHFTVFQGVTIGDKISRHTGLDQRPKIGDYVIACAGVAILGPITIGNKTLIGANSVVVDSLPSRCIAVGAPAVVEAENLTDEDFFNFLSAIKG
jgi:serine O-acetyltransferase